MGNGVVYGRLCSVQAARLNDDSSVKNDALAQMSKILIDDGYDDELEVRCVTQ